MSDRDEMTDNVNDEMIPLTLPRTKTVKFCEPWDATSKFEEALLCILSVQLSILPPAVWCVSYRGSSGAAGMPSSCICPRSSLCVLRSNALSHSSLVSFYIVLPDGLFPASRTPRRSLALHCCLTCTHTDTESADLPAAATVFPAFEKMTRALCICAERCKLANCSRYTWKYSTFRRRSHPGRWGWLFQSRSRQIYHQPPMQTPPVSCDWTCLLTQ